MTVVKSIPVYLLVMIVASLTTIAPFSIDTYLPSFPSVASALDASAVQMQQSLSLYMLGFALMTLFSGSLSDALGRRNITLIALSVFALSSLACALATDINTFLALRFLQGVAASVGIVVGRAVVRDLYSGVEAQKMMSHVMLFFAMAPAVAPIIGGLLEVNFGWRYIFLFLMLIGVMVLLLVMFFLPETLAKEDRQSMHPVVLIKNYCNALTNHQFTVLALIVAFNFSGFFVYITASPEIIFTHLAYAADDFYIMFVPVVLGIMLGSYASGKASGLLSSLAIVYIGSGIMSVASLINLAQAYYLSIDAFNVLTPLVLYSIGMALTMPALTVMGLDQLPKHKGLASSLQGFLQMGGNALVAAFVTPLVFDKIEHMAMALFSFHLIALMMTFWLSRQSPVSRHPTDAT